MKKYFNLEILKYCLYLIDKIYKSYEFPSISFKSKRLPIYFNKIGDKILHGGKKLTLNIIYPYKLK